MTGTLTGNVPHTWPGLVLNGQASSGVRYSPQWLDPSRPGEDDGWPVSAEVWDLNNEGVALGTTPPHKKKTGSGEFDFEGGINASWHHHVTTWNPDRTELDDLPRSGIDHTRGALNDVGDIVISEGARNDATEDLEGFVYVDGNLLNLRQKLGVHSVFPTDINNRGIVTGSIYNAANSRSRAFIYNAKTGGPPTDFNLGRDDLQKQTMGQAINQSDHVLGFSAPLPGYISTQWDFYKHPATAFLYIDGSVIDLGDRKALALNDHDVVVGFRTFEDSPYVTAFSLAAGAETLKDENLGALPGHQQSQANDINNHGDIVGISGTASQRRWEERAFVRLRGGAMQDLNDLIPPESGAKLTSALRINNAGQILCRGYRSGIGQMGCILSPYIQLPPPFHENYEGERYGLTGGSGWVWFGRPDTPPVPINPNELWAQLSSEKRDIILGLTMAELAGRVSDADAREELENAARALAQQAIDRWK